MPSNKEITVKVLKDSLSSVCGKRLTTFELVYPRYIHSQVLTHRAFSKNAASSRAVPVKKVLESVKDHPVVPVFRQYQKGMRSGEVLSDYHQALARVSWLGARDWAVKAAEDLLAIGASKESVNRLLEPFQYIQVILSGTEFDNFFQLRCDEEAQPELQTLANKMRNELASSRPDLLKVGDWHLPLVTPEESSLDLKHRRVVSAVRCARVSYVRHNEIRPFEEDLKRYEALISSKHWSPLEHQAKVLGSNNADPFLRGNFTGNWAQLRKIHEKLGDF